MKSIKLSDQMLAEICQTFGLFTRAGFYHEEGWRLLAEKEENADLKAAFLQLAAQANQGEALSDCLRNSGLFPSYMTGMVKTAEETGNLENALNVLQEYYLTEFQIKKQIRSAIRYPLILVLMMIGIIGILLMKVLPIFEQVYQSLGSGLYGIAGGFLHFGQILNNLLPVLFLGLCVGVFFGLLYIYCEKFRQTVKQKYDRYWGDKGFARERNNVRFLQGLTMGITSGLNIEQGIDFAEMILQESAPAKARCRNCKEKLREGFSLETALVQCGFLSSSKAKLLA